MLKTFKALLKGSQLEWIEDSPELKDEKLEVYVTVLDRTPKVNSKTRGQRMAEILENLANEPGLEHLDPILWQRETREDRSLPER
ncbi:hypothetical protein [Roseofilum capinflatum]|uniref:Uncharacterized protein n=1 Tax=Roseofilum capinflatum BLCC-M114 TaxID=3022440 RepID=A0ABT7B9I6_9CYAN|nr:hypothetical protein [Roseofilum capinflatum]MDJ1175824.1 hypothetical protein [Roseofilum capinflatum BLCC-M114]